MGNLPKEVHEYMQKLTHRPLKLTKEVIEKIEQAASVDASLTEMAYYCEIDRKTLYNWFDKYPWLKERIDELREKPILKARQEVIKGIDNDKHFALQYLKSKRADEFIEGKTKVELEDKTDVAYDDPAKIAIKEKYEKEMRELLIKKAKENANKKGDSASVRPDPGK